MKNYLLIILLTLSTSIIAQEKNKEKSNTKENIFKTGVRAACLLGYIFAAKKASYEYCNPDIKFMSINLGKNIDKAIDSRFNLELPNKAQYNQNINFDFTRNYVKIAMYGLTAIALTTLAILPKFEISQKYKPEKSI